LGYVAAFIFGIAFLFIGERLIHGMNTAMPIPKDIFAKISSGTSAKDERGNDVY
jgi:hypothetical protein